MMPDQIRISAVIFDFNGTLFYDTGFHNQAWQEFAMRHGSELTEDQLYKYVHGSTNKEILKYLFQRELNPEEVSELADEKEDLYRDLCRKNPDQCILTPGAESFLNMLKQNKILRTIATASNRDNLDFFIEIFGLETWFDTEKIIYDNGEYRGKPFPDLFLAAAHNLGIDISKCMVIEDSLGGVEAAHRAGAARIIVYQPEFTADKFGSIEYVDQVITDFRDIGEFLV